MKKKNETIDLGKVEFPTSWEEITLKQFEDLMNLSDEEQNDVINIISILTQKPKEWVEDLPVSFLAKIEDGLSWLNEDINIEPSPSIGEFKVKPFQSWKTKEYLDAQRVLKDSPNNYAMLLAIICRKDNEVYDDDFIANNLDERIKMFERMKFSKAYSLFTFFLSRQTNLRLISRQYSQLKEEANRTLTNIENSARSGGFLRRFMMKYRLEKLKKLMKSI